ncbi:cilia- and flagella-associated protein 43 [Leuresthes tenuis]|uniref:cilia- and flagella-associated protein 43 n=1 Tax=Leuresthes tenuis TaxID=355514 RepID=UPI003B51279B
MEEIGSLEIKWIQGFTNKKIEFVGNKTVCYTCGNHICFLNLETKTQSVFRAPARDIGALTANGNIGIFAFSEQKLSPSIFVYIFPELQLKNELKGTAQLDYTSLALSDGGPYLGCCSSLPDYTITVWNWENAEPICTHPQAGTDVISLVFNPLNWLQLCALGTTSLTVWHIEKSVSFHVLKPRVIQLPATDGSFVERCPPTPHNLSNKLPYYVPGVPPSAISGLRGETAPGVMTTLSARTTVTPSAICWTATSELYVGCAEGFLLLVDPESLSVAVLFNPTTADANPELRQCNFQAFTLSRNGLFVVGKESAVHCLQIKGTQITVTQTWKLERPVITVMESPDNETLLLSSNTGQIYILNPTLSDSTEKVLDVQSSNFLTAAPMHTERNTCVSLRDSGELQLWSSDGTCLGSLCLQAEVTSLACCPMAHYAAVGTASGDVFFIDLNKEEQPRLVHQVHLYHTAVDHLVFDQEGHYLLTSGSDLHVFVLNAKPSMRFSVIGYTDVPGRILSLSTQCLRDLEEVKVLVLCADHEKKNEDGSQLTVLSLPARSLTGPDSVDRHGRLSAHVLKVFTYKVPRPLTSCVLGVNEVFAYCHRNKTIQRFQLPKDTDSVSSQRVLQLKPEQEVKGHPLGPVSLSLSPHCLWLASVGRDGLLRIRKTASMEQYTELQCHSCRLGGVRSVSFSADGRTLLTVGYSDGSLVCSHLRIKGADAKKVDAPTQYSQSVAHSLKIIFNSENPFLIDLPAWGQGSPGDSEKTDGSEVSGGACVDVTEQDESYSSLLRAPPSHPTWLECRRQAVVKEDNKQYFETKKIMKETVRELRDTIQKMLRENENLPEEHFNLDVEEQKRFEAMVEQEVAKVRAEIEQEIVEKCYLHDVLKRECWDSVMVKGRAIKAFHSELAVQNFPQKERTEKELEDLHRVQNIRNFEKAACTLSSLKKSTQKEEQGEEGHGAESATLTGSFSAQLGYSNPDVYDQFILQTSEQRITQIILLQDVIYRIKTAFNTEFEALHQLKVQELRRIRDRNKHIREIMMDLDMNQELWEPSLTDGEWPERLLTVDNSEIKAEKYLTPEQQKEEERRKLEKQSRLAAQGDDIRERALDDMMEGELEVKKVDILKMEIPLPEFVLSKPNIHWSEEEKKVFKEYENKTKDLNEEKEQYKRSLEIEMKRLQESTKDATERFDERVTTLLEKKVKCTVAIYQEELKIAYLVDSVITEEKMRNHEVELRLKLEKTLTYKGETGAEVKRHEDEVLRFHEEYDSIVTHDKVLDKDFRKEFFDVPNHLVDNLYRLFKRRPRVQKIRTQTNNVTNLSREHRLCSSLAPDAINQMLKAMEELDAPENMPEVLNPSVWERFCVIRRAKVQSEQKLKTKALTLAEMQAFLQRRRDEDNAVQQEIRNISEALESLHKKKNRHLKNTMVQVILKQGQVEVSTIDLTADTVETDFILYHRSVVDKLRGIIRSLAGEKVASMEGRKEIRKSIIQLEWEHKVMKNKIEDFNDKMRGIKMLRLSEDQQDMTCRSKTDQNNCMSEKVALLEKSIALMKKTHQKSMQQRMKTIERINKKAALKAEKNATLGEQLPDMHVTVAELRHICEAAAAEENEAAKRGERYQEIVQRRDLEDFARAQSENIDALWTELGHLTVRNFPSLDQLKHN